MSPESFNTIERSNMPKEKTKYIVREEVKSIDDLTEEEFEARRKRFMGDPEDELPHEDDDKEEAVE